MAIFFLFPPPDDRAGESPRLYLPPEPDILKLLPELTDGLLAAELVTSDDISSLSVPAPVKNYLILTSLSVRVWM
jgi:hypothetical protein